MTELPEPGMDRRKFIQYLSSLVLVPVIGQPKVQEVQRKERKDSEKYPAQLKTVLPIGPNEDLQPELWGRLRRSTLMIAHSERFSELLETHRPLNATAFHVGSGLVVTARHVVKDRGNVHFVGHPQSGIGENGFLEAKVVWISNKYEIAFLKIKVESGIPIFDSLPIAKEPPAVGECVYSASYRRGPERQGPYLNGAHELSILRQRVIGFDTGGQLAKIRSPYYLSNDSIITAEGIDPSSSFPHAYFGSSGAPVVNSKGEVVGVHLGGSYYDTAIADGLIEYQLESRGRIDTIARRLGLDPKTVPNIGFIVPITDPAITSALHKVMNSV